MTTRVPGSPISSRPTYNTSHPTGPRGSNAGVEVEKRLVKLSKDFPDNHLFTAPQSRYLPKEHVGVCRAVTADWLRRTLLKDKPSFALTSKEAPTDFQSSFERMKRKFERYQTQQDAWLRHYAAQPMPTSGHLTPDDFEQSEKGGARLFASDYPKFVGLDSEFRDAREFPISVRLQSLWGKLAETARVSEGGAFLINLRGTEDGETWSHWVACQQTEQELRLLDPNVGEYRFPQARGATEPDPTLLQFLSRLQSDIYGDVKMKGFTVYAYRKQ